ncbi:MAG TPA: hypothetical protein PKO36_13535 [Candidatus Hydrogenedentes bacterium]|nr:hypothetical protein [Candidatus Hydrogenedentota bacterium]HOV75160.1 hypothetical protein [Candidatus Hydrogenedentota bacterium]HPC17421.1 hypothetical protein [Candidatus Hydrogenedentota bacterium]HRT20848.1 hypothetical protein [Candidatus Hydrogenedentota bacterium]HRT66071.1 hypothetical protein [Candidatus Hydrogenedentota bacterium]
MDVTIDGVRGGAWERMPQDAIEALAWIAGELRSRGRAMVSVSVDGRVLRPEEVTAELSGKPLDSTGAISIQSEPIADLVAESLDELEQVLPELPQACHRLAEIFQGDDPDAGYEPFQQLAEIWRVIKERELQILSALGLDADSLVLSGTPLIKAHEELNRFVEEAAGALESRDCVLLGDLLEYELAPRAEAEAEIVALLREKAAQG